jgi:hypothetical protein
MLSAICKPVTPTSNSLTEPSGKVILIIVIYFFVFTIPYHSLAVNAYFAANIQLDAKLAKLFDMRNFMASFIFLAHIFKDKATYSAKRLIRL